MNPQDGGVYPLNALKLVDVEANATGPRPSPSFVERLRVLNATYRCRFGGRAVALIPAAQYFLHWLGFRNVVVLMKEPGAPPLQTTYRRQYAKDGAPVIATAVSGETLRVVEQFLQKAKDAGIQPKIIAADFSRECLPTLENITRQKSNPPPKAQQAPRQPQVVRLALLASVAAFLAAAVLWRKRSDSPPLLFR